MKILQYCFRVYTETDKFEDLVAFYEALQGMECERRVFIAETGVHAAKVGQFMIFGGSKQVLDPVRHVDALFYLDDLDAYETWLREQGAEILHGPREVTAGRNLTARHADGLVVEYFQAVPEK